MSRRACRLACCGILCIAGLRAADAPAVTSEVRVGLVAWDESAESPLASLRSPDSSARYKFLEAHGTYAEVLHWLRKGLVDVALLTPGPYAELRASEDALPVERRSRTLGISTSARALPRCVVRKDAPFQSLADIRAAIEKRAVQLVFVDPLSATGRIIPQHALQKDGLAIPSELIQYAYSHALALERVARGDARTVAFVADMPVPGEFAESVRWMELPELKNYSVPPDIWVARTGLPAAEDVQRELVKRKLLLGANQAALDTPELASWMRDLQVTSGAGVSPGGIVGQLRHYARTHAQPPRVALVLSGGGAKCSYQVGATAALEEAFAAARANDPSMSWLDFHLVAGTSGGAINALPVAMELTASESGRSAFADVWRSLDLRQMVRPSLAVCAVIGLWLATLFTLLSVLGVRLLQFRAEANAPRWVVPALVVCAGIFALVLSLALAPTVFFGHQRELRFLGLYWSFGLPFLALFLPVMLFGTWWIRSRLQFARTRFVAAALGLFLLVVSPVLTVMMMMHSDRTLFYGVGIERVLAAGFETLTRAVHPALPDQNGTAAARLKALSKEILERKLIARDLVITGNCLPPVQPSDRYFYCLGSKRRADAPAPAFGLNGVALQDHPEHLLDAVMGSGTIFPIFPPRELTDFPATGQRVELIDGGFAHNSPVEAALWWGATHVILIEATPAAPAAGSRSDFLSNAQDAFEYLYQQTQLADARSRERISIFSLRPSPPHIDLLDFAPAPIEASIQRGKTDAGAASFQRQEGFPRFR